MEHRINSLHFRLFYFHFQTQQSFCFPRMLRLNFSRISLDRKDLDFHSKTHQRRQAARGHDHAPIDPKQRYSGSPRSIKSKKSSSVQTPAKKIAISPVGSPSYEQYGENPVISREPVPRNSKAFWDRVLAEAGTPTRTQTTGSGNARVFDPSEDWLENHRSTRPSIEEDRNLAFDYQDDLTSSDDVQGLLNIPHRQPSLDSVRSTRIQISDDITRRKSFTASLESLRHSTKRGRFSNLFRRRPKSFDTVEEIQPQETLDLSLDGDQSDMQQYRDRNYSTSSGTSHAHSINDGLYGSRGDRRTISSSLETSLINVFAHTQPTATERVQRSYTKPSGADLTIPVDTRRPSGTTSQSPLHISEAAATTSPKMSPVASNESRDELLRGAPNFLSLPPRRPRTYRPRSETYSYELSEASSTITQVKARPSAPTDLDLLEPLVPLRDADHAVSSARSLASASSPQTSIASSPAIFQHSPRTPTDMDEHRAISHIPGFSNVSGSLTSSRSSLSPFAPPFIPLTTPTRNLTPQYQLPPPFGATPRTVSYSHAMPASSSPMTPLGTSASLPYRTSSNASATPDSIPATPPQSSFRVYNDAEPPQTQPQTPADLQRRRRLHLPNTAPARGPGVTSIEQGIAHWQAFASPPRSGRTPTRLRPALNQIRMEEMVSADVENEDAIPMLERERRRVWNGRLRMGQEERRGLDLSPGLMGRRIS